ncbi:MAG: glycosyltransferase family 39 protein [Deltaproteobacteria bacterium]|nr:glycosyltransferase family 39 protein [Deltaproteobacteria bacterium]
MRYRNYTIALLAALAVFRVLYIILGPLDVSPDEAHYWEWSRRLDLSYYSKGPGVAYVIAFFTSIFGANELGIRIGAVVFSTAGSWMIYLVAKELFKSEKIGFYSALLPNITPIFSIGTILMTTDVMLIFFWVSAIYCVKRAIDTGKGGWWYSGGVLVGLGFLSKYTIVLLYPFLALFFLISKENRHWLTRKEPYITGLISLVFATPVIFWNIAHGQVTIKHTMGQAHVGSGGFSLGPFFEFLGSQAGLLTPLIFIGAVYGVWRCLILGFKEKRSELLLVFFSSAPLFLFFLFKSLHGKVQANWAIASFATAFPASVWAFSVLYNRKGATGRKVLKGLAVFTIAFGVIISALAYFPWALEPLGVKRIMKGPPYNRVTGWQQLGDKVSSVKEEMEKLGKTFVASDTYQITSELALYTKGNPIAYNFDTGSRRMNQYDLWSGYQGLIGYNALYVKGGIADIEPAISEAFDRCDREVAPIYWDGKPLKEFSLFRCYNFKGMERHEKNKY